MTLKCGDEGGKTKKARRPCGRPAGWGTEHPGNGKCKLHGGSATGRPPIHGRYSVQHRKSLESKMQEFLADPAPANLMPELAIQRALLQDFLTKLAGDEKLNAKTTDHVFAMTESISRLVERITRMLNQTAITQMDIHYLQVVLTDLIVRYIDDPTKRTEFMVELRSAFGENSRSSRPAALRVSTKQSIE